MSVAHPLVREKTRRYLSPKGAAESYPGMTVAKLAQLRFKGEGPPFYKPTEKTVLYDADEFEAWILSTRRTGTAKIA